MESWEGLLDVAACEGRLRGVNELKPDAVAARAASSTTLMVLGKLFLWTTAQEGRFFPAVV